MPPTFISPIVNGLVSSGWLDPRAYRDGVHHGLDFHAPIGTPVVAIAGGTVLTAKNEITSVAGRWICIDHGNGWMSRYLHLNQLLVSRGDSVRAGQVIAKSGATGIQNSAAHLHFEVLVRSKNLYPFPVPYTTAAGPPQVDFCGPAWPVPSEPVIPATYAAKVADKAKLLGLPLAAAVGGGIALVAVGIGVLLFFMYRRR